MKVTSLKDVETYLYSSVLVPLKQLRGVDFAYQSPLAGDAGDIWTVGTDQEQVRRVRHNYERDWIQERAPWVIRLFTDNGEKQYIVGQYDPKTHAVILYETPFKLLRAMPLLGKFHQMFSTHPPFTDVSIRKRRKPARVKSQSRAAAPDNDWPEDEEEGYDEADI